MKSIFTLPLRQYLWYRVWSSFVPTEPVPRCFGALCQERASRTRSESRRTASTVSPYTDPRQSPTMSDTLKTEKMHVATNYRVDARRTERQRKRSFGNASSAYLSEAPEVLCAICIDAIQEVCYNRNIWQNVWDAFLVIMSGHRICHALSVVRCLQNRSRRLSVMKSYEE